MPQTTTTRARTTRKSAKSAAPVDRLDGAIEAAQDALKDLRRDLSRGRRDLVKDLDKTLSDARTNLRRVRRTLVGDLEEVGRSLGAREGAKGRSAASRRKRGASPKTKA